jgi:S-formylglutathione hydrolase FrmB
VRAAVVVLLVVVLCGCGSSRPKPTGPPHVTGFSLDSKLLGKPLDEVLVTPEGGGKGRPLLVFLHGYGASPSGTLDAAFTRALQRLGDRTPVVLLPEGEAGWWHDRAEGKWGSYVLREAIPAALRRSGADPQRVAIGGISMGGFGALDIGRKHDRFCAVGGHSPALLTADESGFGFDNLRDFARHDLLAIAQKQDPYDIPVWIDVGDRDELRPVATKLARELRADGAEVSFHVWPGVHDNAYWDAHFVDYLRFYADACG